MNRYSGRVNLDSTVGDYGEGVNPLTKGVMVWENIITGRFKCGNRCLAFRVETHRGHRIQGGRLTRLPWVQQVREAVAAFQSGQVESECLVVSD